MKVEMPRETPASTATSSPLSAQISRALIDDRSLPKVPSSVLNPAIEPTKKGRAVEFFIRRFMLISLPLIIRNCLLTISRSGRDWSWVLVLVGLEIFRRKTRIFKFRLIIWISWIPVLIFFLYKPGNSLEISSLSTGPGFILDSNFQRNNWASEFPPLANFDDENLNEENPKNLEIPTQTVSVIFAAHGEHKYIERTIASIYANTPLTNLQEIILIDDASDPPLEEIASRVWQEINHLFQDPPKIIYKRHETQEGLIRSKTHGASIASGDVIVFLDAHVNAEPNWLPPMLRLITENYKRVVVPTIPVLDAETWTIDRYSNVGSKMMFNWGMSFNWFEDGNDFVPVMSGGLLAIHRRWWFESGEYDTGMLFYGAENIEQSLRIWLCGGEIVLARESQISHLFRPNFPYAVNDTQVMINKVRAIEVWLDEWKEMMYNGDPHLRYFVPIVRSDPSLIPRFELKRKLGCRNFQVFVEKFKHVFERKGMLENRIFQLRNLQTNLCVMKRANMYFLADCIPTDIHQRFVNAGGSIRLVDGDCFDADPSSAGRIGRPLLSKPCEDFPLGVSDFQKWEIKKIESLGVFISWNYQKMEICTLPIDGVMTIQDCSTIPSSALFEQVSV